MNVESWKEMKPWEGSWRPLVVSSSGIPLFLCDLSGEPRQAHPPLPAGPFPVQAGVGALHKLFCTAGPIQQEVSGRAGIPYQPTYVFFSFYTSPFPIVFNVLFM